jgi:hypothetical protein
MWLAILDCNYFLFKYQIKMSQFSYIYNNASTKQVSVAQTIQSLQNALYQMSFNPILYQNQINIVKQALGIYQSPIVNHGSALRIMQSL